MSEEPGLNGRARRAVPLVAAALTVAMVTGLLWLRPQLSGSPGLLLAAPSPTAPILGSAYRAAYQFVSPALGWALVEKAERSKSQYWLFHTSDAAQHWTLQTSGSVEAIGYEQLTFFDARYGYFYAGADGAYRTSDGGSHWTRMAVSRHGGLQITFSDPVHGWYEWFAADAAAGDLVYHFLATTDGGDRWRELPPLPGPLPVASVAGGFVFRNGLEGWLASPDLGGGILYSTQDGGSTWQRRELPPGAGSVATGKPGFMISSVRLIPGGGVMVEAGNGAYVSIDGGATWRLLGVPVNAVPYDAVAFLDAKHWWSMGSGDLYKSDDAGQHWHHVALQLDDWEYIIGVIDSRHAWARLEAPSPRTAPIPGSALALTSDGGVHWTYVNVPHPA